MVEADNSQRFRQIAERIRAQGEPHPNRKIGGKRIVTEDDGLKIELRHLSSRKGIRASRIETVIVYKEHSEEEVYTWGWIGRVVLAEGETIIECLEEEWVDPSIGDGFGYSKPFFNFEGERKNLAVNSILDFAEAQLPERTRA